MNESNFRTLYDIVEIDSYRKEVIFWDGTIYEFGGFRRVIPNNILEFGSYAGGTITGKVIWDGKSTTFYFEVRAKNNYLMYDEIHKNI